MCALEQVSIPAATAVLDYDLLTDAAFKTANYPRRVVAGGCAGSAVILDAGVRLNIDNVYIATLYNSSLLAVTRDDMFRIGEIVPAGASLRAIVFDAAATSAIQLALDLIRIG